jgi:hypothetical protein
LVVVATEFVVGNEFVETTELVVGKEFVDTTELVVGNEFVETTEFVVGNEFVDTTELVVGKEFVDATELVVGRELVETIAFVLDNAFVEGLFVSANLPARSQVARPSKTLNAMPLTVRPSKATRLAGTSNRAHCPAGGNAPMAMRLGVPLFP